MYKSTKSQIFLSWLNVQPYSLLLLVLLATLANATRALDNPWSKVADPASGPVRVIGSYSAGCIQGAVSLLPDEGPFELMRLSRKRYFAHPKLREFILWLADAVQKNGHGKLMVGDIGQPRGGPTTTGHASHQIGLDADFWFWLDSPATKRPLSIREKEDFSAPSMLNQAQTAVDPKLFQEAQVQVLELVAKHPQVERIFVNPHIKVALCKLTGNADWLNKIRPWWGHHYHFHVRLGCPPGQAECQPQEPPDAGTGCGAELDEWFDPATIAAEQQKDKANELLTPAQRLARKLDRLPKACSVVLYPESH